MIGLAVGSAFHGSTLAAAAVLALGAASVFWTRTKTRVERAGEFWLVTLTGLLFYLGVVVAFEQVLGSTLTSNGWQGPWFTLALVVLAVTGTQALLERHQSAGSLIVLSTTRTAVPVLEGVAA